MRTKFFVTIVLAMAASLVLAACSQDMSNAEIRERASDLGMMTKAQADAMAQGTMMSDVEVMARAAQLVGAMNEQEVMALAEQMGMMDMMGDTMMEGDRLQAVKDRGKVICASRNDVPGYGQLDEAGNNVGFDIDLCRALAAAVLGDPNAIEIRLISAAERGPTIQSGEVDMLVRTVTWTTSRDSQWGNYAQTMFFDGQGFLVNKELGISSALELKDATVCVTQGTTTELNLQDFSNQNNLNLEALTFEDTDAVAAAYQSGQCDAFTNDRSQLAAIGSAFQNRDDHVILPETISEEPLGPVVPHGDDQWFDIVKTVMSILIYAEAYSVDSMDVPTSVTGDTKVDRLFGLEGSFGQESLGLSKTAAQDVIKAVGNYGEIYNRNLGPGGYQPSARERAQRPVGGRHLHGLPEGRSDLRRAPKVAADRERAGDQTDEYG